MISLRKQYECQATFFETYYKCCSAIESKRISEARKNIQRRSKSESDSSIDTGSGLKIFHRCDSKPTDVSSKNAIGVVMTPVVFCLCNQINFIYE